MVINSTKFIRFSMKAKGRGLVKQLNYVFYISRMAQYQKFFKNQTPTNRQLDSNMRLN